jgi:hypothetical protein
MEEAFDFETNAIVQELPHIHLRQTMRYDQKKLNLYNPLAN